MAKSLQEQLLGAGIVDKKKANKIKAEKLQTKQKMKKGQLDNSAEEARQAELKRQKEEKAARDKELNLKRQAEIEYKAILGQIRQIIIQNRVAKEDGEIAYNFTDDKKVKKLYVSEKMHKDLSEGRLAIAKLEGQYEIVPKGIAEKVQEKEPNMILVLNTSSKGEEIDEDDPYAEFQIPDDLMW
ncbi:DUF2058 domain-containing protein [Marinomonas communis]|uniref:DUF2058 domain-containing protein n=1 Tax=Marinomonas communis TaxID=28254 RepID=UPI001D18167A|nr:DUF2058 domain-containing protein [Marinomonas communis]MCC4272768.1 DUF2058 domain-containing protein [Marinomonas communis]